MRRVETWFAAVPLVLAVACTERIPNEQPVHIEGQRSAALVVPTFVQVAYATPQSSMTSVSVTFASAQSAGDLNVVAVGWNDTTASVTGVTDTAGNSYVQAAAPTSFPGQLSQSIYYAKNIKASAAGANAVKVTFSQAAAYADIRILEYSGMDTVSPFDGAVGASGTSAAADSGGLTTTNASDLLFGANMTTMSTVGPGTGFTSRIITFPDSDLAEDRLVSVTGNYHATASVSAGGAWVMQLVAFKSAPGDTQPPTAPASLTATGASSAAINLSWTAATDNVGVNGYLIERCQGAGCSNFTQIAAPPGVGTTFSDTGLPPSTTYQYRVRAADAAGNLGPYSPVASAATLPDTTPPSAPSGLTANGAGASQINLAWTAATDDVGVTGYLIERCQDSGCTSFVQIAAPAGTGTTYSDTGLSSGTSFSYRVRATDAAGNLGPYSATATASTATVDTQPPTAPTGLSASTVSDTQIGLSWNAATDNVGVTAYLVERCQGTGCTTFAQIGTTSGSATTYSDSGLGAGTTYVYRVRATDAAGNLGPYSGTASATTSTTPPPPTIPTYAQGNFACPQSAQSTVSVPFLGAQGAGDLNVVVVGWNDTTARITNVTDSKGNAYALAVGPTQRSGVVSQAIYYAANIAAAGAGANTVTVTFSPAAQYADVRIVEYVGVLRTNPLDVVAGASGSSATPSSGSLATTTAGDLLVGANTVTTSNTGAGSGWVLRTITAPDADLVEDRIATTAGSYAATAPLSPPGDWVMQAIAFKPAPADTTPPLVSITSPAAGATLSGTAASITVSASDPDSGVAAVQLLVDGVLVGTTSGNLATFSLDTTVFANGSHQLTGKAVNGSRLIGTSTPVGVTFSNANPGNPAVTGIWSGTISLPLVSVHSAQLPGGKILMSDAQNTWGAIAWSWDTATNAFTSVPVPANVFCSASEQLPDGRIFVAGGHAGAAHAGLSVANLFDPVTQSWTVLPDMANPRWYPATTTLSDGRVLVLAGESNCDGCEVLTPEIYNPSTNSWSALTNSKFSFTYYPHVFLLPDGRVLVSSTAESPTASQVLDLGTLKWTAIGGSAVEGGTAAQYRPGKVIKTGTSVNPDLAVRNSSATTYVLDTTQTTPSWRQVGSLNRARTYATLTLLPDGTVLATGGGPTTAATDTANAILQPELWSPTTETWTLLGPMHAPRLYHSEALLMPDGRVLVYGGGRFDDATLPTDQFNAEFFAPPYLFKGTRPVISSAPTSITLGTQFTVQTPDASRIASVVLMRFAAVTHNINMGQRYVPLSFTAGSGSLTVTAPANHNQATPGNYMLFLVDTNGVPSVAAEVRML